MVFRASRLARYQWWFHAGEKEEGNHQAHPDNKAEQAEQIHRRKLADAFLPKLSEVGHHANREKRHNEKDAAEGIGFDHRGLYLPIIS